MAESSFAIGTAWQTGFADAGLPLFLRQKALVAAATLVICSLLYFLLRPDPEAAVPYTVPVPPAYLEENFANLEILQEPSIHVPGSTAIQCYCPANGKLLGRINPVTANGIDRAIEEAAVAQAKYRQTTFATRRKVLKTLLQHILDHREQIARAACLDSGKTRLDAAFGEILVTAEKIQWAMSNGERVLRPERRRVDNLLMCYKTGEVRYEPLGVCAACVSWNYPFHNVLNPMITALITGNGLIVKPSERTAHSMQYFLAIVKGALQANGQPANLIASAPCWPDTANHLTSHPGIAHVTFIGSRPVAHHVAASAARSLTPLVVELGGKDPAIVLDNTPKADLPRVASILMRGVFQAAGQNCIGIERIIAQPGVHDELLAMLAPRVRALRVGSVLDSITPGTGTDDVDVGACISDDGFARLEALITEAVQQGATLHCGGTRLTHPGHGAGHFFAPTLLSGVQPGMRIAREELFAPVMVLLAPSTASSVAAVIRTANAAGSYGLGAAVFGARGSGAVRAVTAGVRAGMVCVNDFASFYVCSLPFGGVGGSGYGRFGGPEGLRGVCNAKAVCDDGYLGIVKTGIPPRMDYRVGDALANAASARVEEGKRWAFVSGVIALGFGISLKQRAQGLWNILANM